MVRSITNLHYHMAPFPMRFVPMKGKEYYRFVDDVSEPTDEAGFIRTVWPASLPHKPNQGWPVSNPRRLRWDEVRRNFNHDKPKYNGLDSGDEGRKEPGRARKRKQNGQRGRGRNNKRFRGGEGPGCNSNYHGIKRRREEDDDDEGENPPEARDDLSSYMFL